MASLVLERDPGGRQADAFPDDPTQWEDLDGDGLGDSERK